MVTLSKTNLLQSEWLVYFLHSVKLSIIMYSKQIPNWNNNQIVDSFGQSVLELVGKVASYAEKIKLINIKD